MRLIHRRAAWPDGMIQLDRRALIWSGAALAALQAAGCATTSRTAAPASEAGPLAGRWSTAFADQPLDAMVLRQVTLDIEADGAARIAERGHEGVVGRVQRGPSPVTVAFDAVPDAYSGGWFFGAFDGPDRLSGFYVRAAGFETEVAFVRGDQTFETPPRPALTQIGLDLTLGDTGLPALGASASHRSEPARLYLAGMRRKGGRDPVTPTDQWRIGGLAKAMTGTLAGRLVEQGAVRWEDTIGEVLGAAAPNMLGSYRTVTLRHLLSHKGGVKRDLPRDLARRYATDLASGPRERLRLAGEVLALAPGGPVGVEESFYSNAGYALAAAMMEQKTGRAFEDLIVSEVFTPLGLSAFTLLGDPEADPPGMTGSERSGGPEAGVAYTPARGVAMSLPDLLKFAEAHRDRPAFLRPETWRELHTDTFGGAYAKGWDVGQNGRLSHFSNGGAFSAFIHVAPDSGVAAVTAANAGNEEAFLCTNRLLFRAAASVAKDLPPPPAPTTDEAEDPS